MSKANDPAFPCETHGHGEHIPPNSYPRGSSGLTKREYFAVRAMQGIMSTDSEEYGYDDDYEKVASLAVKAADALIAELEKKSLD